MAQLILEYVVFSVALGYWAWALVYSGVFKWLRDYLEIAQLHFDPHDGKRPHYYVWKFFKFFRDMLRCPFCTGFHLAEIAQLSAFVCCGAFFNVLPMIGHLGIVLTWFALAGTGGATGFTIGYITGNTWHYQPHTLRTKYALQHGEEMSTAIAHYLEEPEPVIRNGGTHNGRENGRDKTKVSSGG
jgi:hypothetical protein